MCGIVGSTGSEDAVEAVLDGLEKLEYRGYDSAGMATIGNDGLEVVRVLGRVEVLREKALAREWQTHTAIGHTRWATHGPPSERNAHPHRDPAGNVAVVHNGIIENYAELRKEMEADGVRFSSETDTEVAACMIGRCYDGDLLRAVEKAIERLEGSFAFAVLSPHHPGLLVGARRGSPLVVGIAPDRYLLASDALPILKHTRKALYLEDDQVVALKPGSLVLRQNGASCEPSVQEIKWDAEQAERGGFEHFMLKEIHEQPAALRNLASKLIADSGMTTSSADYPRFKLNDLPLSAEQLKAVSRIIIVGQGTAYHAGMVGRIMIERTARVPVQVEYGCDFRYRDPVLDSSVLVLAVSQSGETADTLGAVRLANERGCRTLSVINTPGSTIARESDGVIYMQVGPEIGVASTKAFTGQIAALYVMALHLAIQRRTIGPEEAWRRMNNLRQVPLRVEKVLGQAEEIHQLALKYKDADNILYLGRGTGYPLALEGALKLKEVSYIHAEGMDAGEMKHGPIALIDENMPVVFLALKGRRYEKILSNIQEVKARGAQVLAIASEDDPAIRELVDDVIPVSDDHGIMNSIVCSVPLQLIAYYVARARGCDVDKPRNLAKSVTVE